MRCERPGLPFSLGVAGLMQAWPMPRSSTCQRKPILGLGAVVGLDHLNGERELLGDVVEEPDRGALVGFWGRCAERAAGCSPRWR